MEQFTWSVYAPPCVPNFHGNNGGNTSRGVTGSTITFSFAVPPSADQTAVNSLAGSAAVHTQAYINDLETYINFFNRQFELYGRHVVLKTFQAQGNYLEEDSGQDLAGAQADAQTAASMPAFLDLTFPLYTTQYYEDPPRLFLDVVVCNGGASATMRPRERHARKNGDHLMAVLVA